MSFTKTKHSDSSKTFRKKLTPPAKSFLWGKNNQKNLTALNKLPRFSCASCLSPEIFPADHSIAVQSPVLPCFHKHSKLSLVTRKLTNTGVRPTHVLLGWVSACLFSPFVSLFKKIHMQLQILSSPHIQLLHGKCSFHSENIQGHSISCKQAMQILKCLITITESKCENNI